jgi:flagellar motor switch protein FliN/FliY
MYAQPMYAPPQPKVVNSQPMAMPQLDLSETLGKEQAQNLDLIMGVPLQVTVEIGRTKRKVQDILSYSKGSLVVLDKLAGDQVDLFVNGKCIARGDVVVIEDNFGVRITEILQKPGVEDIIQK